MGHFTGAAWAGMAGHELTSLSQLVNYFVVANRSWRWSQWTTLSLTILIYLSIAAIRETHPQTIRHRREVVTAEQVADAVHRPGERRAYMMALLKSIPLVRPLKMLVVEPVVTMLSLYIAFTFAVVYCFSTSIPYSFSTVYHFAPKDQGLVFSSLVLGYMLSAPSMAIPYLWQIRANKPSGPDGGRHARAVAPERLLFPAIMGSVALPISFFWFAWSAKPSVHWICPTVSLALFAWGNNLIYVSIRYGVARSSP